MFVKILIHLFISNFFIWIQTGRTVKKSYFNYIHVGLYLMLACAPPYPLWDNPSHCFENYTDQFLINFIYLVDTLELQ